MILEEYKKISLLGKGAFGQVYLAEKDGEQYALKSVLLNSASLNTVKREIYTLKKLSRYPDCNKYVVCYYDGYYDEKNKTMYILMEYFQGYTIDQYVDVISGTSINYDLMIRFTTFLFEALNYIHGKGVAHRDIKAGNVMFNEESIKLVDFGLACLIDDVSDLGCKENTIVGSYSYMAPEVWTEEVKDWKKADVWSAGVLVYYISVRDKPFKGGTKWQLEYSILNNEPRKPSDYPEKLMQVIDMCLVKDPEDRATSKEILDVLRE